MRFAVGVLVLAGLLMGPASPSHGQEGRQYGLALGVNQVTMQTPDADPASYVTFGGGFVMRQPLFGPVSIQPELLLNQKGAEIRAEKGGGIEFGAGYLELPLLLHLKAPAVQSVVVHGEAGGFGAVKLFERQTPDNLNTSFDAGTSFFRRTNAGIVAGIGATIPIRGQRLNLTARRTWGLRDVARDVEDQPFEVAFPAMGETRAWSFLLRFGL